MILSIVIPAYNEENFMESTLNKIQLAMADQAINPADWEIIVCDNNSDDNTAQIAKNFGVNVVLETENQISLARNTGASAANGSWLLFIDADTYPTPELMRKLVDIVIEDKLIGCGSTVAVEDGTLFNKLRMERLNPLFRLFNISGGAFILCEREAFEHINGFSADLFTYEEFDFIVRLKKYGRSLGKGFKVLHKYPVITSGRKGDISFLSITRLVISNFMAVILFILYYILPGNVIRSISKKTLRYWYKLKR